MSTAVVFHHLVRMEDVAANLAPPARNHRLAPDARQLIFARADLHLDQLASEHLLCRLAVLHLRSLILAGDDGVGRNVRESNRRFRLVDVLPACATRSKGVDADLVPVQHHILIVLDLRDHLEHGERGLSPFLPVERGDAHHAVDASLCAQPTEDVATTDLEGHAAVSRTFALGEVDDLVREPVPL